MCGRFTLSAPVRAVADLFKLTVPPPELAPRYNVAPTQKIPAVAQQFGTRNRRLAFVRWGLVPHWAQTASGPPLVNAKSETVDRLPSFRESFVNCRCIVPATGFFEWKAEGKKKVPYLFRPTDGGILGFAAIYDQWGEGKETVWSCAILTTTANEVVQPFHDRMPVALDPSEFDAWLDDDTDVVQLKELLNPLPPDSLESVRLKPVVNSVRNEGPQCVEPAEMQAVTLFD